MITGTDIDKAVEAERDRDVDAIMDTRFEIVDDTPHIYNATTWNEDCADFLLINDVVKNDELRRNIAKVLVALKYPVTSSQRGKMLDASLTVDSLVTIGRLVVENCIANGLTEETVGERY